MEFTCFRWNIDFITNEWAGLTFYGKTQQFGPSCPGRIRLSTLKQIIQHVANKRELSSVLVDEANRLNKNNDGKELVIENVDHFLTHTTDDESTLTSEQLDDAINKLDAMDLESVDFNHVVNVIDGIRKGVRIIPTVPEIDTFYYRACHVSEGRPELVARLSAPPAEKIKTFQRCNAPTCQCSIAAMISRPRFER